MRDIRKDLNYYKAYIEYQNARIEKKLVKLQDCDSDKKQRVLVSLTGYEIDLLKAEFSSGATRASLKKLLEKTILDVSEYKKITFEDLLILLSMTVLLDNRKDAINLIKVNRVIIESDRLLKNIASFIETGKVVWDKSIPIRKEYSLLDDVFSAADKVNAMLTYLDNWYSKHTDYAWYNSHLGDADTYCGYWSFEAAAIAKELKLDVNSLKKSDYYPVL